MPIGSKNIFYDKIKKGRSIWIDLRLYFDYISAQCYLWHPQNSSMHNAITKIMILMRIAIPYF